MKIAKPANPRARPHHSQDASGQQTELDLEVLRPDFELLLLAAQRVLARMRRFAATSGGRANFMAQLARRSGDDEGDVEQMFTKIRELVELLDPSFPELDGE